MATPKVTSAALQSVDFQSSMPHGLLDKYRQEAGFCWQQLQSWLDVGDILSIKVQDLFLTTD